MACYQRVSKVVSHPERLSIPGLTEAAGVHIADTGDLDPRLEWHRAGKECM